MPALRKLSLRAERGNPIAEDGGVRVTGSPDLPKIGLRSSDDKPGTPLDTNPIAGALPPSSPATPLRPASRFVPGGSFAYRAFLEIVGSRRERALVAVTTALHTLPILLPVVLVVKKKITSAAAAAAQNVPGHCKLLGRPRGSSEPVTAGGNIRPSYRFGSS